MPLDFGDDSARCVPTSRLIAEGAGVALFFVQKVTVGNPRNYVGQVRLHQEKQGRAVCRVPAPIYTGRMAAHQAKRDDEMQAVAVADALSPLANIVMAWNTAQMQAVIDHWNNRRREQIPPKLVARIAPTRIERINLRGSSDSPSSDLPGRSSPPSGRQKRLLPPASTRVAMRLSGARKGKQKMPMDKGFRTSCRTKTLVNTRCAYR